MTRPERVTESYQRMALDANSTIMAYLVKPDAGYDDEKKVKVALAASALGLQHTKVLADTERASMTRRTEHADGTTTEDTVSLPAAQMQEIMQELASLKRRLDAEIDHRQRMRQLETNSAVHGEEWAKSGGH